MSDNRREIDLIIKAAVQGQNNLPALTKSISDLEKAITSQADAAKRGEVSLDELKATLLALQQAQDKLIGQDRLIAQFKKLADQVESSTAKLEKSTKTHLDFKAKLDAAGKTTEAQGERLARYAAATERAEKAVAKQKEQQQDLSRVLEQSGIDVNNLAAAEDKLKNSAATLGLAINKSQKAISEFSTDLKAARTAQKELADTEAFNKQAQEAAKLVRASEYVNFWEQALNKADSAQKQFAANQTLRKAADDAVAAARGYSTLGSALNSLNAPGPKLGDTIRGIIDPAKQVRSTLQGIESEIKTLGAVIDKTSGEVVDYTENLTALSNIQKAIQGKASLVDDYQRQVVALRAARTEFANARREVLQYAESIRSGKGDTEQLLSGLAQARSRLDSAAQGFKNQVNATRSLRDSMRAAGLSTNDLAGTQGKLTQAAKNAVTALQTLTDKHKAYNDAVKNGGNSISMFQNSGRTTLSLLQRIKGELLAATTAYIGFYGVINNGGKIIDAYNARQQIQNQLAISVGNDTRAIAEEYKYAQGQAERLGIEFEVVAKGYAKFLASGTLAGRSKNELRVIFESFSEVGRVAGLTKDNMDGVFKALEQVLSKGTIQAEELRGQLGDRLFGAFQVAAQALKDEFPDLNKAMKDGLITSDQLIKIAEKYRETVASQLPAATKSLTAEQDRLNTAIFDFKLLVADSGFTEAFSEFVTKLTEFFKSKDGEDFAKSLSKVFTALTNSLIFLLDHLDIILKLGASIAVMYAGKIAVGVVANLISLTKQINSANTASRNFAAGLGILGLAVQGYFFLQDQFDKNDKVAGYMFVLVDIFRKFFAYVTTGTKIAALTFGDEISYAFLLVINKAKSFLSDVIGLFAKAAELVGAKDLAKSLGDKSAFLKVAIKVDTKSTEAAKAELKSEIENITRETQLAFDELAIRNQGTIEQAKPSTAKATVSDGTNTKGPNGKKGPTAEELAKVQTKINSLIDQINGSLNTVEDGLDKKVAVTLDERLAAIDKAYTNLEDKIAELAKLGNGKKAAEFSDRLNADKEQLKVLETKKYNEELIREKEALESAIESIESQAGKKEKQSLKARLDAITNAQKDRYRQIEEFRKFLADRNEPTKPADDLNARLDNATAELKNLETRQFYLDGMATREKAINDLLAERTARIQTLNIEAKAGLLTDEQIRVKTKEIIDEIQPKIEAVAADSAVFASAIQAGFAPERVAEFTANLAQAVASARDLRTELFTVTNVTEMLRDGATTALDTTAKGIGDAIVGAQSWGDAIEGARNAFLNFAADFLRQIALMIIKQQLLNAIQKMGGGSGGFLGTVVGALNGMVKHDGGVVNGTSSRTRSVDPTMFVGAPRYHTGGIAGLAPNEYPAILEKNEEVLKKSDPRNVLNGGASRGAAPTPMKQDIKIINAIDSGSMVSEGLSSQEGQKAIFNFMRANRTNLKTILGS
jgi:tape measure domain-containing protein